ncbi:MAG TPA: hypothetical protein PKJ85_13535, partial [Nitrosomonas nitrosa]|nr:hypothetical protein [Nitrosomonas nitrosa]
KDLDNTFFGQQAFFADLVSAIPPSLLQGKRGELTADIAFGELLFIHHATCPCFFSRLPVSRDQLRSQVRSERLQ